jgi:3-deoxy-manno-octulosonate cytidylyltransferase (CMP-KDO synthetase)
MTFFPLLKAFLRVKRKKSKENEQHIMNISIIIPARYQSSRLPGKPLKLIAGKSLLERVWRIAKAVKQVESVYITTDDQRIADHASSFGASVVMTASDIQTGTDRVEAAVKKITPCPEAIINLQGDAVLTPPWVIQALVDSYHADPSLEMVTAAVQCSWEQLQELEDNKKQNPGSGTLVTFDKKGRALYFSKNIIPYLRQKNLTEPPPIHRHIGIYGYTPSLLQRLSTLEQTPLEKAEQLEQLRALENGIPIQVVLVDYRGHTHASVDAPDDIAYVESLIAQEGELLP